MLERYQA
jgi:Reverse transcriptase (RNA-dependent DNA polymerase)